MKRTVTVEEAKLLWQNEIEHFPRAVITLPVEDALGYVLADTLVAMQDIPSFSRSAVDGYAVPFKEECTNYTVVGLVGAGTVWNKPVHQGEAIRIMTGAPIPEGCDTVFMQEFCEIIENSKQGNKDRIIIHGHQERGQHIIIQGEECVKGTSILEPNVRLEPEHIAMAVSLGYTELKVYAPLKALLLTSGREIVEPGTTLTTGKVFNSNRYLLKGLLEQEGITDIKTYHVSDDPELFEKELVELEGLFADMDIVISTGGVSVGLFDSLPLLYERLGASILYTRIAMRPGAATMGAICKTGKQQFIFGLSGNPSAAYQNWLLMAKPVIRMLQGLKEPCYDVVEAELTTDFDKKSPVDRYVQGVVCYVEGKAQFTPSEHLSGSAVIGLHQMNALLKLPKGSEGLSVGSMVQVYKVK